jgi:hypothetical protein
MKNLLFLLVLLFSFSSNLLSQNFGLIGTEWFYSESAGGNCPGNCEYVHFKSVADTIIQGKTTHKITQTYYKFGGDTAFLDPLYVYNQSDTTFRYSFSKSRFLTLFIFNRNQGDTLTLDFPPTYLNIPHPPNDTIYRLVIDSVINKNIDGIPLKEYRTTALDYCQFFNYGGSFMDRIGGFDWLFPRTAIFPEAGGPIRCYKDSQIDTSFQTIACDYILPTLISELTDKYDIEIYPNPTSNILTIKASQPINKIELYDLTGRLLVTTNNLTLDFSKLAYGQYIIKIHFKTGENIERKIIKNVR